MDMNNAQSSWPEVKSIIKSKWSAFNDSELDEFKDNLDQIPSRLQLRYGLNTEEAERQFLDFKKSLESDKASEQPRAKKDDSHEEEGNMTSEGGYDPMDRAV